MNFVKEDEKENPPAYVEWRKEAVMLEHTEWEEMSRSEFTSCIFLIGHTNVPDGAFLDGFLTQEGIIEDPAMGLLRSANEI